MILTDTDLAFVSVPQSALFVKEAPARYFGSVTAFRTTTGQLGFALGFAASGAMVSGFGFASLRDRMLKLGASPDPRPGRQGACNSRQRRAQPRQGGVRQSHRSDHQLLGQWIGGHDGGDGAARRASGCDQPGVAVDRSSAGQRASQPSPWLIGSTAVRLFV